ncbi:MAG: hypothetical protein ACI84O_000308 [Myxococcota bacterium]|jgi:hypothetical protein
MNSSQLTKALAVVVVASAASCLSKDESVLGSSGAPVMSLTEVSNGFGRLLPYVIPVADPITGGPTAQLIEIRQLEDLYNNPSTDLNPILPPVAWPTAAINPANASGNHFVVVSFTGDIDEASVLDPTASGLSNNGLTGAITVVAYDRATGQSTPIPGRAFINGYTYFGTGPARERWVRGSGSSAVEALTFSRNGTNITPGIGFPGTSDAASGVPNGAFASAGNYIAKSTFMFVADNDDDLTTYDTFPANKTIRVVIKGTELGEVEGGVRSTRGFYLENGGIATSAVAGDDGGAPITLLDGPGGRIVTSPRDADIDVPCDEEILWSFNEACQPHTVGPIPGAFPPSLSSEFTVEFYPPVAPGQNLPGTTIPLAYTVAPVSPFNLTTYIVSPVVPFPGQDPFGAQSTVAITYWNKSAEDLFGNQEGASIQKEVVSFVVGSDCPGLVNAPVMPGAIIIASNEGMKVLDLDGFGQGTGDPTHDYINTQYNVAYDADNNPVSGDVTKFPFNPNLGLQGLFPPLTADTTSLAAGSRGVFTLTQDTSLSTALTASSNLGSISDIMIGHPLDLAYNNWECIAGGQNNCASLAFQTIPLSTQGGRGNNISNAPHPNPPRLQLAPSCYSPLIQADEPTQLGLASLLGPGNSFGNSVSGLAPSGLLTESVNYGGFWGPAPAQTGCPTFVLRQQIGHFLFVLDETNSEIVVLNSNRMTTIKKLPVVSPRDLAISPDLNILAVSNNSASTVTFIDTDPFSPTFLENIKVVSLVDQNGRRALGPTQLVWQGQGEDILVICDRSDSMAIISGNGLAVRKIIAGVNNPKLLAVTDRSSSVYTTGLYYAYVVLQNGDMKIFESGPDGLQGIGFDEFIGEPLLDGRSGFENPSSILINPGSSKHSVFVAYAPPSGAFIDDIWLDSSPTGAVNIRLSPGVVADPSRRGKEWLMIKQYKDVFSSSSIRDMAVDDLNNFGAITTSYSVFGGSNLVPHSSKALSRAGAAVSLPRFLFAASSAGFIDVLNITAGTVAVPPIRTEGVSVLAHYWRQ